eukprot:c15625_g1_i1.p1 GENE.c15625_g1_i1~~c15625_g1_i1.p1  ORF type:complete len:365 (+),score=141.40 c15625_g1_i1:82-1095(+)
MENSEDEERGKELFEKGIRYAVGLGNKEGVDDRKSYHYFREAFHAGYVPAGVFMASPHENGYGMPKNKEEAERLCIEAIEMKLEKIANNGDQYAQIALGYTLLHGYGVPKDPIKAYECFLKPAKQKNSVAQYWIGLMYESGEGIEKNIDEAIKWLELSAIQKNSAAQYTLGELLLNSKSQKSSNGIEWCRKSAEQNDPEAQYRLGTIYERGDLITRDINEAIKWYKKSAENHNADAQNSLALNYENENNINEAKKWFIKAADNGHADAQYNLGLFYQDEEHLDIQKSLKWLKKCAEQDDVMGQYEVGSLYYFGFNGDPSIINHMNALIYFFASILEI